MKPSNYLMINRVAVNANIESAVFDISQVYRLSAQVIVAGGTTATGSLQFLVSNDPVDPVNWSNLGSAVAVSATPSIQLVAQQEMAYRWFSCVYTDSSSGAGNGLLSVEVFSLGV